MFITWVGLCQCYFLFAVLMFFYVHCAKLIIIIIIIVILLEQSVPYIQVYLRRYLDTYNLIKSWKLNRLTLRVYHIVLNARISGFSIRARN